MFKIIQKLKNYDIDIPKTTCYDVNKAIARSGKNYHTITKGETK